MVEILGFTNSELDVQVYIIINAMHKYVFQLNNLNKPNSAPVDYT